MAAMALEPCEVEFDAWLGGKLRDLNTDEGVFGSYIKGILIGDESNDEKIEALEGIISEITENDISELCREILEEWQKGMKSQSTERRTDEDDVEKKLVKLLESQTLQTVQQKQYTEEERRLREAILAQYSQIQVQDECDFDEEEEDNHIGIEKNTNAASIQQAEKEKREQARLDSQKKKEKDKEDREKQKQQLAEKKEKRKTQKSERRR
ncbi:Coiled-coil domain-containing protein 43 [Frankliniella fusca]|uniref:Coiled-coil domain-containing protein 43 n=1 Tax=Frankliniella fusca TaxID=407009 RepID=A0AAE1HJG8_9NEOP|nr:Coiled-coil domain-containing protein 43 [Frankliniella fusca]